jgi:hypothetical protein
VKGKKEEGILFPFFLLEKEEKEGAIFGDRDDEGDRAAKQPQVDDHPPFSPGSDGGGGARVCVENNSFILRR